MFPPRKDARWLTWSFLVVFSLCVAGVLATKSGIFFVPLFLYLVVFAYCCMQPSRKRRFTSIRKVMERK